LKGGIGLFHQPPLPEQVVPGYGSPELASSRALQRSLGIEQEFGRDIELSLEGYSYKLSNLIERDAGRTGELEYNNDGSGTTFGLETLLRIKPMERFYGWLAYTLSRSLRRANPDAELLLSDTDSTHVLTALGSYQLGKGWEVGSKFMYVAGTPYTPVAGALYSSTTHEYVPVLGEPKSRRLPAYHELDLRVQKRWEIGATGAVTAYADVINVYGKDRVVGIDCSEDLTRCQMRTHPMPVLPSVGLRGEF
jgi:outer membrane cobalamin receptor